MPKYAIQSKRGAPPQGAYSQGWRAGDFIFVTGTGPIDPSTGNLVGDTIEQQTARTIDNLSAILEADGASLREVVKVTVPASRSRKPIGETGVTTAPPAGVTYESAAVRSPSRMASTSSVQGTGMAGG